MKVINDLRQMHRMEKPCVIALGTFDGLHLGHQDVIKAAQRAAAAQDALLAVFTFSNHPMQLIRPEKLPAALLTKEQKYKLLEQLGVELLVDLPFNWELANLSPLSFIDKLEQLGVCGVVVGENFTFGCKGAGNCELLAAEAAKRGFKLDIRPLITNGTTQELICSTAIRRMILNGQVEAAAGFLGRCYVLSGTVAHGNERGRLLGFPTANIELAHTKIAVPPVGVYAVRAILSNGAVYNAMANIGNNPTFGDVLLPRLEVHIFDFAGDIYGEQLTIEFIARLRDQVKFVGIDALKAQLAADKAACKAILDKSK